MPPKHIQSRLISSCPILQLSLHSHPQLPNQTKSFALPSLTWNAKNAGFGIRNLLICWCHFQVQKGKNFGGEHKKSRKNPILEYLLISILNFKPNFFRKNVFFYKKKSTTNPPWSAGATISSFPSKCNPAHRSCGAIDTSSTSLPGLPTSPYKASKRSQRWRRRSRSHLRDAPPRVFCCCSFLLKINGYPLLYAL